MTYHLTTRIPEGRHVDGLDYGARVTRDGWSGCYVRPADCSLPYAVARLTPADNELPGDDTAVVDAVEAELYRLATTAERVAAAFDNDGQLFEHPTTSESLESFAVAHGADIEHGVRDGDTIDGVTFTAGPCWEHLDGDPIRYAFPDGSAVIVIGEGWDIEGQPWRWRGD